VDKIRFILKFVYYKIFSKHRKGFGIHSPFVFEFITEVLYSKSHYYAFDKINELRLKLLSSKHVLQVQDLGAGSKKFRTSNRKLRDIARFSGISKKNGEMLFSIIQKYQAKTILELGTSIGLGTLYLASAGSKSRVTTIEACPQTASHAAFNFEALGLKNIRQILGNINEKLPVFLSEIRTLDFVYFDGNHKEEATINYFNLCKIKANNNTIFVFDDIHWSRGMEKAWRRIQNDESVTVSIDLFFSGIVFFNKELSKQHFVVRF
jgi:predicted O-methyltransferase YrrM